MPENENKDTSISAPAGDDTPPEGGTDGPGSTPDLLSPELLEQVPQEVRNLLKVRLRQEITCGPLPPPSMLKEYEQLLPGCTKQLLTHWDDQARHRQALECREMSLEEKYLDSSIQDAKRGQLFAFILCLSIIIAGVILACLGYPWPGALLGTSGMASLVYAFRAGRGYSARAAANQAARETQHDKQDVPAPKE